MDPGGATSSSIRTASHGTMSAWHCADGVCSPRRRLTLPQNSHMREKVRKKYRVDRRRLAEVAAREVGVARREESVFARERKVEERERQRWVIAIVIPAVAGLAGSLIGVFGTLKAIDASQDATAADADRLARRETYAEYRDALNAFATAAAMRHESCVPQSSDPLTEGGTCSPIQGVYQGSRYRYQVAVNDMYLVATDDAITVLLLAGVVPDSTVGAAGEPVDLDSALDEEAFSELLQLFGDVQRCDTLATQPNTCDATYDAVDREAESRAQ